MLRGFHAENDDHAHVTRLSLSEGPAPDHVEIGDTQFLFSAHFKKAGADLVLTGDDGHKLVLVDYFNLAKRPDLTSHGATLSADLVTHLAGPDAPGQYAQAGAPAGGQVIGKCERIGGGATVQHANGVTEELKANDAILKGDVVMTNDGSSAVLSLLDGTVFNMGASARMVLSDLIYDANSTSNSAVVSLVKGTFSFVAGHVARTGDMKLDTPVATMGIRGTAGTTTVNADATGAVYEVSFSLMPDPDGHVGLIQVLDRVTGLVIGTISTTANVLSVQPTANFQVIANESPKAAAQVQAELAAAQVLYPAYQAVAATVAAPPAPAPPTGPQGGQQQNNSPPGGSLNIQSQTGPTLTFNANVNSDTGTVTATKVTVDPTPTVTPPTPTPPNPTVTTPTPPPEPPPPPPAIIATTPPHLQELGADQPGTLVSVATLTVTSQIDTNALVSAGWAVPAGAPSTFFQKDFAHGTASLDINNSTLTYSLNVVDPSVAALHPNQTLQDSVAVPVQGGPSTTVDFTIDGVTHPTGQDASASVSESLRTHATQIILHPQATDPISSHLTYSAETLQGSSDNSTGHGTVVANPDGSFTYTPKSGFYGTDTISFKAHDGPFLTSDDFSVTVNVSLAAPNDTATAQVDVNQGVATGNLLADDPNQDVLTVTNVVTDVANDAGSDGTFTVDGTYGELVVQSDGSYTYTLAATPAEQAALFSLGGGHFANDVFLYTVSDGHGATAQADLTVAVTGQAPTISIAAIIGDNMINASEANVGFSITGSEAGADGLPITVTIVDGNGVAVESYNITGAQGGWSVNVTSAQATALADGSYTVTAQVTDQFGNPSTTATQTLEVHETLPTVTISALAADGDNVINHAEAQGGVMLGGSVTGLAANSTFSITVTDGSFSQTYQATVNSAGTVWTATIPSEDATELQDGTSALAVTAQVTDQFGNTSATATQTFTVEETLPTVTIDALDADGDNVINYAEAQSGVMLSGSVTGLAAGAAFLIMATDGSFTKTYSAAVNTAGTGWTATIPSEDATTLQDGVGALTVTAQVTDQFGNTSATATQTFSVEETLPTVTIDALALDGDNAINHSEAQDGITLSGTVTGLAAGAGFLITATDGLFTKGYTATVNAAGTGWTATIPSDDATTLQDGVGALTVTAQVTDQFGNTSATATQTFSVEETLPTVTISAFAADGDNVINHSEAQDGVTLSGTVTRLAANSTFDITATDGSFSHTYHATVNAAGTGWTASIPPGHAMMLADGTLTVTAQVTDQFGNTSATATQTFMVDETAPTITINTIADDNVLNALEAQADLTISGSTFGVEDGRHVTVTFNGHSYDAEVSSNAWTTSVAAVKLAHAILPDGSYTVTANVSDAAGNPAPAATQTLKVDETAPTVTISTIADDNVLNALEAQSNLAISGTTFGVEDGRHVTVTFNGHSYDAEVSSNAWTTSVAAVNLAHAILPDGSYTVTANVSDAAGNPAPTATQTLAVNDPPVILPGQTTASGSIIVPAGAAGSPLTALAVSYLTHGHDLINGLGGSAGFGENVLAVGDDNSSSAINITSVFGSQGLNFFGHDYTSLYINNNGNITFAGPTNQFTPAQINAGANNPIIAAFWADVDTRGGAGTSTGGNSTGSNRVYYDLDATNGVLTVTWDDVGYYNSHKDKVDAFQLQLVSLGNGNFDIVYRYQNINWTTGDASGGSGGLGGQVARAGFSAGDGVHYFELPQSGNQAQMLALETATGNTGVAGVDLFQVSNGEIFLTTSGHIDFTDVDTGDVHSIGNVTYTGPGQALGTLTFVKDSDTSSPSHVGQFTWTYSAPTSSLASFTHDDTRTETFDVTIGDGNGNSAVQTISVILHGPDQAPVAVNDTAAAQATHPIATGNLLANDHDPDADTLTVTGVVNGEATSTTITVHGSYGDLVVTKATGDYTYTLGATAGEQAALEALGGAHSAPDTFTYTADDGHGGSAQANLTVTATGHSILHVGNGGYATIQAAINAASAGDTIEVAAGTYNEHVDVNKAVTIDGANFGVDGNGARGAESVITGGMKISADGATVDGVEISGSYSTLNTPDITSPPNIGLLIAGAHVTVENSVFSGDALVSRPFGTTGAAADLSFEHNLVENWTRGGYLTAGSSGSITDNTFVDNANGVYSEGMSFFVSGNTFSGSAGSDVSGYIASANFNIGTVVHDNTYSSDLAQPISVYVFGPDGQTVNGSDVATTFHLEYHSGSATVHGGAGSDAISYADDTAGVTIDLLTGTASGAGGTTTFTSIENAIGGSGNDTLTGNGASVLEGGPGDDHIIGHGDGTDTASYEHATGGITVDLSHSGPRDTGGAGVDTLSNISNLFGSQFDDHLIGDNGNNVLDGGFGGHDTLTGGAGNDTFVFHGNQLTVTDFQHGQDQIDVSYFGFTQQQLQTIIDATTPGDHALTLAANDTITFQAVDVHQLQASSDFILSHGTRGA